MAVRITQEFVESLFSPSSRNTRLTQEFIEVLFSSASRNTRLTQEFVEVLFNSASRNTRLTQVFVNVLISKDILVTVNDSFSLTDSTFISLYTPGVDIEDSFTISDSSSTYLDDYSGIPISISDTLSQFLDSYTIQYNTTFQHVDIYYLSDTIKLSIGLNLNPQDQLSLSDDLIYDLGAAREAYDTFQYLWNDSVDHRTVGVIFVHGSDNLDLSDSINTAVDTIFRFRSVSDTLSFSDSFSTRIVVQRFVSDALNLLADFSRIVFNTLNRNTDNYQLFDNSTVNTSNISPSSSSFLLSDSFQIQLNTITHQQAAMQMDQLSLNDSVNIRLRSNLLPYLRRYLNDV